MTNNQTITITPNMIRKTDNGRWGITIYRKDWNHRLVHLGGAPYPDTTYSSHYFDTRKKALAYANGLVAKGYTAKQKHDGMLLLSKDNTAN